MNTPSIQITQSDYNKLQELLRGGSFARPPDKSSREALMRELTRAKITPPGEIPPDVITLHSRARLRDLGNGDILELSIVLPDQANLEAGCISILAPLGTAMLGYRKGDVFDWEMPGGQSRFQVEDVLFQPEAANKSS